MAQVWVSGPMSVYALAASSSHEARRALSLAMVASISSRAARQALSGMSLATDSTCWQGSVCSPVAAQICFVHRSHGLASPDAGAELAPSSTGAGGAICTGGSGFGGFCGAAQPNKAAQPMQLSSAFLTALVTTALGFRTFANNRC